jgi:uncharacterized membrane protein
MGDKSLFDHFLFVFGSVVKCDATDKSWFCTLSKIFSAVMMVVLLILVVLFIIAAIKGDNKKDRNDNRRYNKSY